ncbi:MAG: preQ(1) synthase [Gemmatimonadales bacterium]
MSQIPAHGPLPKPESPQAAREYLKASAFPAPAVQNIVLTCSEFTSVCPATGQPDFGTVTITYEPDGLCLESRALKYYLWSYRDEGAFCETIAARISDDIVFAVAPRRVDVRVTQNVRGGIAIIAEASRSAGKS